MVEAFFFQGQFFVFKVFSEPFFCFQKSIFLRDINYFLGHMHGEKSVQLYVTEQPDQSVHLRGLISALAIFTS